MRAGQDKPTAAGRGSNHSFDFFFNVMHGPERQHPLGIQAPEEARFIPIQLLEPGELHVLGVRLQGVQNVDPDEPTGGLSLSETRKVLKFVSSIKESGKSCIFITHNLFHVYPVADRIIVLDRGKIVDTFVKGQIRLEQLEAKLLEIAGTSDIDLKVPVGSKAISQNK
jgi:hypothetical protein